MKYSTSTTIFDSPAAPFYIFCGTEVKWVHIVSYVPAISRYAIPGKLTYQLAQLELNSLNGKANNSAPEKTTMLETI